DVRDASGAEEALLARERAVDELIDEYERTGSEPLAKRSARGDRHQIGDADALERIDVGAVVDLAGRNPVPATVARQKCVFGAAEAAAQDGVGRRAKRRSDALPARVFEPVELVDAAAAEHTDHAAPPRSRR